MPATVSFLVLSAAALACWPAALLLRAFVGRSGRPLPLCFLSLLTGIAGLALAVFALMDAGEIEVDRTKERQAELRHKQKIRDVARKVLKEKAAKIRFAEDAKHEPLDLAGIKKIDQPVIAAATQEVKDRGPRQVGRVLQEPQLNAIRRLARMNLLAAALVAAFVLASLVVHCFQGFAQQVNSTSLLPLAGRTLDHFYPETEPIRYLSALAPDLRAFLVLAARRGEGLLCLCPNAPETGKDLNGLSFGRGLFLRRLPVLSAGNDRLGSCDPLFQAVWDRQAAVFILGGEKLGGWLEALKAFLRGRAAYRHRAPATLNLVWCGSEDDSASHREELAVLCRETNCRLVLAPQAQV
jgi:hypothetical protein